MPLPLPLPPLLLLLLPLLQPLCVEGLRTQASSVLSIYFHFPYQTPFCVIVAAAAAVTYAP